MDAALKIKIVHALRGLPERPKLEDIFQVMSPIVTLCWGAVDRARSRLFKSSPEWAWVTTHTQELDLPFCRSALQNYMRVFLQEDLLTGDQRKYLSLTDRINLLPAGYKIERVQQLGEILLTARENITSRAAGRLVREAARQARHSPQPQLALALSAPSGQVVEKPNKPLESAQLCSIAGCASFGVVRTMSETPNLYLCANHRRVLAPLLRL